MAASHGVLDPQRYTRNEVLKSASAVAGGLGVVGLIAGCGGDSSSSSTGQSAMAGEPKRGGTLNVSMSGGTPKESLDPARLGGGNENLICGTLYDRLLRFDDEFQTRPELAEHWETNGDATRWTFRLRANLKFSDGSPLTTKDVKSTVLHILDEKVGSSHFSVLSANLKPDGIEVVDDRVIRFNLYKANSIFPITLGDKYVGIVKAGTADQQTPVGAGAFMMKSWTPGQNWDSVRNPHYWQDGLPYLDGVRGVNVSDSSTLLRSVTSGQADLVGPIDYGQANQADSGATKLLEGPNAQFIFAIMDTRQPPFDDPRIPEALKIAVNRQTIINASYNGRADGTSDVLLWPGNASYPPDLGVRAQDIEKAKALLAQAGHPDGIDLELFTSSALGGMVDFATTLAQVVADAGFRIKIRQTNPATYFDEITGKRPFFVNWTAARAPLYAVARFYVTDSVFPFMGFSNAKVDALYEKALATPDEKERDRLTQELLEIVADDASNSVPAVGAVLMASKKNVEGVELSGAEFANLQRAYVA